MDYNLYLMAWIAFLITLITLKLFGMFSGERDFDITIEGMGMGGVLDGKYSPDSFHVNVKASQEPGGTPLVTLGNITGNY